MHHLIIDATNLLYRIWHVTQHESADVLVAAYIRCINKYMKDFAPDACYYVSDKRLIRGVKNFRRQDTEYKQNRDKDACNEVHASEDIIEQLTTQLGMKHMFPGILEADDVIAYLCTALEGKKTIVSTDNDMAQLVNAHVQLYSPIKKILITHENFEQHFPVAQSVFLRYKSILGDASDNIKGLPGHGKVKAKRLAENYDAEYSKLTTEQQQCIAHNMQLVDLHHGFVVHPEEKQLYDTQLHAHMSKIT